MSSRLTLPALRERREDIPSCWRSYFAEKFARGAVAMGKGSTCCITEFLDRLQSHHWPGNVRELGNFMRRMC